MTRTYPVLYLAFLDQVGEVGRHHRLQRLLLDTVVSTQRLCSLLLHSSDVTLSCKADAYNGLAAARRLITIGRSSYLSANTTLVRLTALAHTKQARDRQEVLIASTCRKWFGKQRHGVGTLKMVLGKLLTFS